MEVQSDQTEGKGAVCTRGQAWSIGASGLGRPSRTEYVAGLLEQWRSRELRASRRWMECRGLSHEQLEDIYQEVALIVLEREYHDDEHLRYAVRWGIRMRARNMRRDQLRHEEILAGSEPELRLASTARQELEQPERQTLAEQDRLVAWEFLTELNGLEKQALGLVLDGMGYQRIAGKLGIEVNEARRATRAAQRKLERFRVLYSTGRMCRYREATILALQRGEKTSEALAQGAVIHLESCARCRSEHKTSAERLRRRFQDHAAALLPGPMLSAHSRWFVRLGARARIAQHRLLIDGLPYGNGGVRARVGALLTGSGVTAKIATGAASLAVVAGTAVGVTHALHHATTRSPHDLASVAVAAERSTGAQLLPASFASLRPHSGAGLAYWPKRTRPAGSGRVVAPPRLQRRDSSNIRQHEPGGFAYLGVPVRATQASLARHIASEGQSGGGLFSP